MARHPLDPRRVRSSPASLRDVAEEAGVSVATASRVLSNSSHPVSARTRAQVLQAAERLSFEPNRLARALVTTRSQTIGVIVHDIADPYFADIVRGLEDGVAAQDYRLFVSSSDRDPHKELEYVRAFHAQQVDAIVFAASGLTEPEYQQELLEVTERYERSGGVVVALSEHVVRGARVVFDNVGATQEMVRYLVSRGHRRIAFLRGPSDLMVSTRRLQGYRSALSELGIEDDHTLIADGGFTILGGSHATESLLERTDFSVLLASNDLMAIGATRAIISSGRQVPRDVSVAGFDDILLAEFGPVPLTTMGVPTYETGRKGADLLMGLIEGGEVGDEAVVGHLVERESVGDGPFG